MRFALRFPRSLSVYFKQLGALDLQNAKQWPRSAQITLLLALQVALALLAWWLYLMPISIEKTAIQDKIKALTGDTAKPTLTAQRPAPQTYTLGAAVQALGQLAIARKVRIESTEALIDKAGAAANPANSTNQASTKIYTFRLRLSGAYAPLQLFFSDLQQAALSMPPQNLQIQKSQFQTDLLEAQTEVSVLIETTKIPKPAAVLSASAKAKPALFAAHIALRPPEAVKDAGANEAKHAKAQNSALGLQEKPVKLGLITLENGTQLAVWRENANLRYLKVAVKGQK